MDDLIKRRLIGAAIVLFGVFLLTLVLPRPGDEPPLEPGAKRVTLDLTQPLPAEVKPDPPKPAPAPALKEEPSATAVEAAQAEPHIDSPPPEPAPEAKPQAVAPQATPAPKVVEPPAAPAVALVSSTGSKPVLKMEQRVMTPIPPRAAPLATTPPKAPAKPAATRKTAWFVQIGSYTSIDNARVALDQLKPAAGSISPADTASGTLYRVRLGPYPGKEQAKAARDRYAPKANLVED